MVMHACSHKKMMVSICRPLQTHFGWIKFDLCCDLKVPGSNLFTSSNLQDCTLVASNWHETGAVLRRLVHAVETILHISICVCVCTDTNLVFSLFFNWDAAVARLGPFDQGSSISLSWITNYRSHFEQL